MSDAIVSAVLTQLLSVMDQQIRKELRLVKGVDKEIQRLKSTFEAIRAVLSDADRRQLKNTAIKVWVQKLKDVSYDVGDVLDEWSTAILKLQIEGEESTSSIGPKKACFFFSFPCVCFNRVAVRRDIALKIKELTGRLDVIGTERATYNFVDSSMEGEEPERFKTTSFVDVTKVHGRDEDKKTLTSQLLYESSQADTGFHVISIIGMGGIGKTTLAQLACDEVRTHFDKFSWVCVSEPFDEVRVAKAIVESFENITPNLVELENVLCRLRDSILGQKFLLVLDDVWSGDIRKWEPLLISLKACSSGSKILVTTRNMQVAMEMGATYMLQLGHLSDQDSWSVFSQIAFSDRPEEHHEVLEGFGRKIVDKCKGLPLAIKTIGSLLRFKTSIRDWQNVLNNEMWDFEEAERGIFPPLLLSYYDLPADIKRCFSYCANFPKDHKIEAENLIKIWMAQGYLGSDGMAEMELRGQEYLDILVVRSFFQDLEPKKGGEGLIRFKMHDIVHDVAQFLSKDECFIMEARNRRERRMAPNCRHFTFIREGDVSFPASFDNTDRLHTFWVQSFYDCPPIVSEIDRAVPDIFNRLKCLKVLDLSRNRLRDLPEEVQKLMNLRYLNLSHNPLSELPETVCCLCNLQTLKLFACDHLRKLPQGIDKLINLRHLEIDRTDSLVFLPRGIGRLSSLRTLSKFMISSGGGTEEASCSIGGLKDLNYLRGCLKIQGLGHVTDADEAAKAVLRNKSNLVDLHIDFSPLVEAGRTTNVIEALELHANLQSLEIKFYGGTRFPSWIISLTSLRKLRLEECQNCVCLPPLGKLPSLETLHMEGLQILKCINVEFLGVENDKGADRTGRTDGRTAAFPKLKKLKISNMRSWEEWDMSRKEGVVKEGSIRIMPCLRCLKLSQCDNLKVLPHPLLQMTTLKKLRIHNCYLLQQRYQKGVGEDWIKISHIPKSRIS